MKLSVVLRWLVCDNLYSEIEREKKEMSLDSRSLNVQEDKFFEIMDELMGEGMSQKEAETVGKCMVDKWWEERE